MPHATDHIISALRTARERKAISQRELSTKAGVPQAQISRLEGGAVDIRISSLVSLARALDLEVELVPRKAVSAVETIVRATTSDERRTDHMRAVSSEISKLAKTIKSLRAPKIPSLVMEKALSQIRMLERIQPTIEQMEAIKKFNEALANTKPPSIDPDVFAYHAKVIENIRNQVVHAPPPPKPPTPAYSLDNEDEDDA